MISGEEGEVDIYQITVYNSTGVVLPSTGGTGTKWFYILGGAVILGAGVLWITRKRRRS